MIREYLFDDLGVTRETAAIGLRRDGVNGGLEELDLEGEQFEEQLAPLAVMSAERVEERLDRGRLPSPPIGLEAGARDVDSHGQGKGPGEGSLGDPDVAGRARAARRGMTAGREPTRIFRP